MDTAELYLKCFIKNIFDFFLRLVRDNWEGPNREMGFLELRNVFARGGCYDLAANGIQDGCVSVPFNYGINHANGRPFRSAT